MGASFCCCRPPALTLISRPRDELDVDQAGTLLRAAACRRQSPPDYFGLSRPASSVDHSVVWCKQVKRQPSHRPGGQRGRYGDCNDDSDDLAPPHATSRYSVLMVL